MNFDALPSWLVYTLLFLLFGVAPAISPLLGPSETDALQASADVSESLAAMHAAAKGP